MPIYNVDLDKRECVEVREVEWEYLPIETVITNIREAAEGLTDPTLDLDCEDVYDLRHYQLAVSGKRALHETEVRRIRGERERDASWRKHMASFRG